MINMNFINIIVCSHKAKKNLNRKIFRLHLVMGHLASVSYRFANNIERYFEFQLPQTRVLSIV
jgi:hypothetical protein